MGLTGCPKMSVWNYLSTLHNFPEQCRSQDPIRAQLNLQYINKALIPFNSSHHHSTYSGNIFYIKTNILKINKKLSATFMIEYAYFSKKIAY